MDPRPFISLAVPRIINRPELPPDLATFYAENEGVGLESSSDRFVRIGLVDEVVPVQWRDLHILGRDELPGWEQFAGFRIAVSCFFDEIVYVTQAPCCQRGAVLALGVDVAGPGGSGAAPLESSLLLAASFPEWLQHLEEMDWVEYGLAPGTITELPETRRSRLRQYYLRLNPLIAWGKALSVE